MELAEGPRAVGELAAGLPISRPAVSQHLRVLKTAGLVSDDVVGTRHLYRLNPVAVAAFRDQLDTFWSRALAGYADAVTQGRDAAPPDAASSATASPPTGPADERPITGPAASSATASSAAGPAAGGPITGRRRKGRRNG